MSEETKPEQHTADTAIPPQGSAPENNQERGTNDGASTVGVVDPDKQQLGEKPESKPASNAKFALRRIAAKEQKNSLETLKSENEQLKQQLSSLKRPESGEVRETDPFDDPKAFKDQVRQEAIQAARSEWERGQAEQMLYASASDTEKWLRTRSHIQQDPSAVKEINELLVTRYAHTANVDPAAAGKMAYLDWCESKGVEPDLVKSQDDTSPAHARTGVRSSGAGKGGPETITPDMAKTMKREDVLKAVKEGRYKGKVISI